MKNSSAKNIIKDAYVLIILICTVVLLTVLSEGKFISQASITNILRVAAAPVALGAVATLLMITGNIDLSISGSLGMTATLYAMMVQYNTVPMPLAAVIVIAVGAGCGYMNGCLVTKLRITPVIATLATTNLFLGIGKLLLVEGTNMYKLNMPENMNWYAKGDVVFKIPLSMIIAAIVVVIFVVMQKKSTLGKYSVAIGGNQTAAALAGINVKRTVTVLYILMGMLAALGGITRASYLQAGDPTVGNGIEIQVIIAILLGGASFSGGKGSVLNTIIATFIMICLDKGLSLVGVESYWAMLVSGMVFIGALVAANAMKISEQKTKKRMEMLKRIKQAG